MGELTIKIGDADALQVLSELASMRGHPVEAEAQELLLQAVKECARRLELVRRADEIAAMTPKGVPQTDSVILVREGREERENLARRRPIAAQN